MRWRVTPRVSANSTLVKVGVWVNSSTKWAAVWVRDLLCIFLLHFQSFVLFLGRRHDVLLLASS